ncbi:hypothetical protein [Streptomyces jumonjinensis]|uniref:Uncharacterized protein n=1 Tax=Streptomyces jumonjinensis TaxID=1945 RepID=A0A646KQ57_STRJU|nr:hypothetical protein [Streptomyces jumonjinensis]MQT03136.1 hypothetical protein [Streptomyces jumonjinensis]
MTAIPAAVLTTIRAAEEDADLIGEDLDARATRVAMYLASSGWTITPTAPAPSAGTRPPCPTCGTSQLITTAGLIRRHRDPSGTRCPSSGTTP